MCSNYPFSPESEANRGERVRFDQKRDMAELRNTQKTVDAEEIGKQIVLQVVMMMFH